MSGLSLKAPVFIKLILKRNLVQYPKQKLKLRRKLKQINRCDGVACHS